MALSGERRFALIGAAALALVAGLAFWFAVPFVAPGSASVQAETPALEQAVRVDVNHADLQQLCTLPGVGEKTAQAILDYRERNGAFEELWELRRVKGISQKLVDSWGELAYVG